MRLGLFLLFVLPILIQYSLQSPKKIGKSVPAGCDIPKNYLSMLLPFPLNDHLWWISMKWFTENITSYTETYLIIISFSIW